MRHRTHYVRLALAALALLALPRPASAALARTDVGIWVDASTPHGTSSFSTGAFTPSDNSILIVTVGFMGNNTSNDLGTPTISGGGLSYTAQGNATLTASYSTKLVIFTALITTSPGSMSITVDDDDNQNIYSWAVSVVQFTGHDTSTPIAGLISSTTTNIGDGAETQTLTAAPTTDDVTLFALGMDGDNNPANPTLTAGWTKIHDDGGPNGSEIVAVARRENSTSTSVSVTDVYAAGGGFYKGSMISFIVKASTGGGGVTVAPRLPLLGVGTALVRHFRSLVCLPGRRF